MISPAWIQLDAEGPPARSGMHTIDAGAPAAGGRVLAGLDEQGLRHLLVPLAAGQSVEADRRSAGVHLVERELEANGGRIRFADLACRRPHLTAAFAQLADEVVDEIRVAPSDAAGAFARVLGRWRELLDRDAAGVLAQEELVGLFGELWALRGMLQAGPAALRRWTGPTGARHDFTGPGASLEVKTTLRREGRTIEVHGIDQLEAPAGGRLFLAFLRLERADAGESVPDLVSAVAALVQDPADLHRRLAAARYDRAHEDRYRELCLQVLEHQVWEVDDAFPRIIGSTFAAGATPAGTMALRYRVDLDAAAVRAPLGSHDVDALQAAFAAPGA